MITKERKLKIYKMNSLPFLKINSKWLQDLGFEPGSRITVECKKNKIVIKKDLS